MTWLVCNNADVTTANTVDLDSRVPFMEYNMPYSDQASVYALATTPPPRYIKTHLQADFFSNQQKKVPKTIVVMRNPKDVLASSFNFYQKLFELEPNWDEFFGLFKQGELPYGNWVDHCLQWWRRRDEPNILILKYEEIKKDHVGTIRKIAQFCGKELTEEQVAAIAEHTFINNMRHMPSLKPGRPEVKKNFIRKGKVGDWKEYFSQEQIEYVDELLRSTTEKEGLFFEDSIE